MWRRKSAEDEPGHRIARFGDVAVVSFLRGRYPSESEQTIETAMTAARDAAAEDRLLVLDFGEVEWIASTAFRPLAFALKQFRADGGKYVATGGGPLVHTLLRFFPDLEEKDSKADAIAALSAEARMIYGREEGQH